MQPAKATPMNGRTMSLRISFFMTNTPWNRGKLGGAEEVVNDKGAVFSDALRS
jgi:hypothetical protein